jgi:hypothetical protein
MSRFHSGFSKASADMIEILEEDAHSRTRTYPYLATGIALTGAAGALTMGNIVEIIPVQADEIDTLQITHACDIAGNITIDLNGHPHVKAVAVGNANAVALQLRAYTYDDWVVTGDTDKVYYWCNWNCS